MECPNQLIISYISFGFLNSFSIVTCSVLAVIYLFDSNLSKSPGKLVAFNQIFHLIFQLANFFAIPELKPNFENQLGLCTVLALLRHCSMSTVWAYSVSINLEILLKVKSTYGQGSSLPHWIYHVYCSVVFIITGISFLLYGQLIYDEARGCSYEIESIALYFTISKLYYSANILQAAITIFSSIAILTVMWRTQMYTSFLVWHVMWVLAAVIFNSIVLVLQLSARGTCLEIDVKDRQINITFECSFGLFLAIIRGFDPSVRKKFVHYFGKTEKNYQEKNSTMVLAIDNNYSYHNAPEDSQTIVGYEGIFKSLKTKFVLDSLTSLSLLFQMSSSKSQRGKRLTINSSERLLSQRSDDFHTIWYDRKILKRLFKDSELEMMFDSSKTQSVHSSDFKLIEYFPYTFETIRNSERIEAEDLIK